MAGTSARSQDGLGASRPGGGLAPLPGLLRIKGETEQCALLIFEAFLCLSFVLLTGQARLPLGPGTRPMPRRQVALRGTDVAPDGTGTAEKIVDHNMQGVLFSERKTSPGLEDVKTRSLQKLKRCGTVRYKPCKFHKK